MLCWLFVSIGFFGQAFPSSTFRHHWRYPIIQLMSFLCSSASCRPLFCPSMGHTPLFPCSSANLLVTLKSCDDAGMRLLNIRFYYLLSFSRALSQSLASIRSAAVVSCSPFLPLYLPMKGTLPCWGLLVSFLSLPEVLPAFIVQHSPR